MALISLPLCSLNTTQWEEICFECTGGIPNCWQATVDNFFKSVTTGHVMLREVQEELRSTIFIALQMGLLSSNKYFKNGVKYLQNVCFSSLSFEEESEIKNLDWHTANLVIFQASSRHGRLARWIKWRACDVGEAKEGLENELWRRWSNGRIGEWAET